ncbi:prohormone-1-like [Limulus polyphemus]|uniref:Prohormone-1-like n=1 Tax=Limulus polyphemus TaxID=6850 RepID=A0ABM1BHY4_LIMPO|nr:prohormone-1-like [Limulus polyphemus]
MLKTTMLFFLTLLFVTTCFAKSLSETERGLYSTDLDIPGDDGSVDAALLDYLFARQMVQRLRNNLDISDLQKKRTYWKQCAFNAVSCFGRK